MRLLLWPLRVARAPAPSSRADFSHPLTVVRPQNTVQMNHSETPVYQSVIEKSKGLLFRAQAMASAIEIRAGQSSSASSPFLPKPAR